MSREDWIAILAACAILLCIGVVYFASASPLVAEVYFAE